MFRLQLFTAVLTVLVATMVLAEEEFAMGPATDLQDGVWAVVKSEARGEQVELRWNWTFKSDGKALLVDRKAGTQSLFRYKLKTSKEPYRLELVYLGPEPQLKGYRQLGIWKIEDSTLTMALNPPGVDKYPSKLEDEDHMGFRLVLDRLSLE